jgi:hypothetical protein
MRALGALVALKISFEKDRRGADLFSDMAVLWKQTTISHQSTTIVRRFRDFACCCASFSLFEGGSSLSAGGGAKRADV